MATVIVKFVLSPLAISAASVAVITLPFAITVANPATGKNQHRQEQHHPLCDHAPILQVFHDRVDNFDGRRGQPQVQMRHITEITLRD